MCGNISMKSEFFQFFLNLWKPKIIWEAILSFVQCRVLLLSLGFEEQTNYWCFWRYSSVVGGIVNPQWCPCPNPQNLWILHCRRDSHYWPWDRERILNYPGVHKISNVSLKSENFSWLCKREMAMWEGFDAPLLVQTCSGLCARIRQRSLGPKRGPRCGQPGH